MKRIACVLVLVLLIGCGSSNTEKVVIEDDEPLTVELWNTMDITDKYELETLERLRESDPKLKSKNKWKRFMAEVVVPQRRIDIPTEY